MKRACVWGDDQKAYDLRAQAIVIDVEQCNCSININLIRYSTPPNTKEQEKGDSETKQWEWR